MSTQAQLDAVGSPTVTDPYRFVALRGGHAWLYIENNRWVIEHCIGGYWHACPLGDVAATPDVLVTARRHLGRRSHNGPLPLRLIGIAHAGPRF